MRTGAEAEQTFAMVAAERRQLADLLDGLSQAQWDTPSLCAGWRVREVAAHLLMELTMPMPRLVLALARNRFDFDEVADQWARSEACADTDLAARLRTNAENRFTPPGIGPEGPLTHLVIHGQDIRRPLGLVHDLPAAQANLTLDQLVSRKARRLNQGRVDGLSLTSTDTGWTYGEGAGVQGSAAALITTIAGRPAALHELHGDGVGTLRDRFA